MERYFLMPLDDYNPDEMPTQWAILKQTYVGSTWVNEAVTPTIFTTRDDAAKHALTLTPELSVASNTLPMEKA